MDTLVQAVTTRARPESALGIKKAAVATDSAFIVAVDVQDRAEPKRAGPTASSRTYRAPGPALEHGKSGHGHGFQPSFRGSITLTMAYKPSR